MKTVLKISLILNIGLIASLEFIYLAACHRKAPTVATSPSLAAKAATTAPSTGVLTPTTQIPTRAEPIPFSWKQLYALDYHDYVKNLRAVGCPEATVRAIVAADVHAAYSVRANEIEKQLSDFDNSSWTNRVAVFKEEGSLKDELQEMPEAEAAEVADLLGLKPAMAETAQPSRRGSLVPPVQPASPPLVFQKIDSSALNLTEDQEQAIAGIQQDFLQQVGGRNQNPSDPAYQARWQQAQSASDAMLQAMLGYDAYSQYQVLAAQKSLENQAEQQ